MSERTVWFGLYELNLSPPMNLQGFIFSVKDVFHASCTFFSYLDFFFWVGWGSFPRPISMQWVQTTMTSD